MPPTVDNPEEAFPSEETIVDKRVPPERNPTKYARHVAPENPPERSNGQQDVSDQFPRFRGIVGLRETPTAFNVVPRTSCLQRRILNVVPSTSYLERRTLNLAPWTSYIGRRTVNAVPRASYLERSTLNVAPRTSYLERRTLNVAHLTYEPTSYTTADKLS